MNFRLAAALGLWLGVLGCSQMFYFLRAETDDKFVEGRPECAVQAFRAFPRMTEVSWKELTKSTCTPYEEAVHDERCKFPELVGYSISGLIRNQDKRTIRHIFQLLYERKPGAPGVANYRFSVDRDRNEPTSGEYADVLRRAIGELQTKLEKCGYPKLAPISKE